MKNKKTQAQEIPAEPGAAASPSFEECLAILEETVEKLERGQLTLDASLAEYERGLKALRRCYGVLGEAQKRIEVLAESLGDAEGIASWRPAQTSSALRETMEALEAELDTEPDAGSGGR